MTETLNKMAVRVAHSVQKPLVVAGVIFGALVVLAAQGAIAGHLELNFFSLLPLSLCLGIVLITVLVRFRT